MLIIKVTIIIIILVNTAFARSPSLLYTKQDLNILYENRQYNEFLAHAKDLRPSERDTIWERQTLEMAQLYIDEVNTKRAFSTHNRNEIERLMKLAKIGENEVFLLARKEFMTGHLSACFDQNKTNCLELAQEILKQSPKQREFPDIPSSFGEVLLENNIYAQDVIYPFMKYAFISERSQFLCRKQKVKTYIFNWFKSFNEEAKTIKEIKLFSADNFNPSCLNSVLNHYIANFTKVTSPIDREQIIHWLSAIDYLPNSEIETLLVIYLLKNPVNGDIFNMAWNTIKNMGENYSVRKNVLNKLKSLDPLPDDVFSLSDPLREKTLFSHVATNLPEYVKFYSDSCLDYYSGSKNFPNGNPTINCKQFLKLFEKKFGTGHPKSRKLQQALRL